MNSWQITRLVDKHLFEKSTAPAKVLSVAIADALVSNQFRYTDRDHRDIGFCRCRLGRDWSLVGSRGRKAPWWLSIHVSVWDRESVRARVLPPGVDWHLHVYIMSILYMWVYRQSVQLLNPSLTHKLYGSWQSEIKWHDKIWAGGRTRRRGWAPSYFDSSLLIY